MRTFGTNLRAVRLARRFSQRELGVALGLDEHEAQHVISRWERGVTKGPHPELLGEVCRVLKCEVAELLELQDERASA